VAEPPPGPFVRLTAVDGAGGRVGSPSGSATVDLTPFMAPGDTLMVRVSFDDGLPVHAFPTAVEYAVMLG
jgi:hypothetical protein